MACFENKNKLFLQNYKNYVNLGVKKNCESKLVLLNKCDDTVELKI